MSGIPSEIPEIGSTGQKLRQSPVFDPLRAGVSTEEYFVWSRIDGVTTLRDLLLMTGFAPDHAVQIVRRLRALGAVLLPGESAAPVRRPPSDTAKGVGVAPAPPPRRPDSVVTPLTPPAAAPEPARTLRTPEPPAARRPTESTPIVDDDLVDPDADELAALAEPVELDDVERRRVLAMARRVTASNPRALLGVGLDADKQAIKRAYFRLSKDFHPDRFYRRKLGSYGARLAAVFEALSHAYEELTTSSARRRVASPSQEPQTPQEYAADLFARACATEVQGDPAGALKLFEAAIRVDGQARYLRRAATCALTARDTRLALEYAKKAANLDPGDPSTARLLAQAFRAAGKLADAEEVLVMAMALKNENDVLGAELRTDLSEVRRMLAARGADPRSADR
jgi:hypothetical protein